MTATIKTTVIQEGSSGVANLTLDGSGNVVGGANISDANGVLRPLVAGTAIASTSGTTIDFGAVIPSWVKKVTVVFNGVSLSASGLLLVQLGTSSGYQTTGYISTSSVISSNSTAGLSVYNTSSGTDTISGAMQIFNITGNSWVDTVTGRYTTTGTFYGGGDVTLSGTLDRLRVTTASGTPTFDAGTINIIWE